MAQPSASPTTGQQPTPPPTSPSPPEPCPDAAGPYTDYQVDLAVAQQRSQLYVADAAIVDPKYKLLDGAQVKYADAKVAQKEAFEKLKERLKRIAETLKCVLEESVRDNLDDCWEHVQADAGSPPAPVDCAPIDNLDCADLPADIDALRGLMGAANQCIGYADTAFDDLAKLPGTLGPTITALVAKATALEQEVCGARTDVERSYVEYLQLTHQFASLDDNWISPTTYGCRLKNAFVILLHRHVVAICLKVEIFAWDKRKELADKAKQAKAGSLIDLVLECAHAPVTGNGQAAASPVAAAQEGTAPTATAAPTSSASV